LSEIWVQEDHLNWPNNQVNVKPLLTLQIPGEITRFVHLI
jgi:hypothetical protein